MYVTRNGWTKEAMKARVRERNNGTKSLGGPFAWNACKYRGVGGNCCAVGCFIEDEAYDIYFEGRAVHSIYAKVHNFPLSAEGMAEMQVVHDGYNGPRDMRDVLCDWIGANVEDAV